jgi:NadR type nicotinamide-nucleotide adenylyltransferase
MNMRADLNSDIRKVVILGPECTGKSELSEYLANYFGTVWVEEYARTYISALPRPYEQEDLRVIARGQLSLEDTRAPKANRVLICDTDLYVIKIWSQFKYGFVDEEILEAIATRKYDLYLLSYIDVPWAYDPQREHPDQRGELFDLYHHEMLRQHVPFTIIKGTREERRASAVRSIKMLLGELH